MGISKRWEEEDNRREGDADMHTGEQAIKLGKKNKKKS